MRPTRKLVAGMIAAVLVAGAAACGAGADEAVYEGPAEVLRLGFFPNVTHAPAIVADQEGFFAEELGDTTLEVVTFPNGPAAMEALRSGAIDATYVGPGPATTAYINSDGEAARIVAGATQGGSALVVQDDIDSIDDLRGKSIATPQIGGTQDIAARKWIMDNGLATDLQGGGDIHVTPTDNSQVVEAFRQGSIGGAWIPEPFLARAIDAGGKILVDDRDLWPNGEYPTTVLAVLPDFLVRHPESVEALLRAQLRANDLIDADADKARADVNALLESVSGRGLEPRILENSWQSLSFSPDPLEDALQKGADDSYEVGILRSEPDLSGLVDLTLLNKVLAAQGKQEISS